MKRLLSLTGKKLQVLMNGRPVIMAVGLAVLVFLFWLVGSVVTAKRASTVCVTAVDECGSELSGRLMAKLESTPGLTVLRADKRSAAEDDLVRGRSEAMIVIHSDYDEKLRDEEISGLITLVTAPSSVSSLYIRETASGCILSERARATVLDSLIAEGYDAEKFDEYCSDFEGPNLYRVTGVKGASSDRAVFGKGFPGYTGFCALALMLVMLTVSKQLCAAESGLAAERLRVLPNGRTLSGLTDILALTAVSLVLSLAAFVPAPDKSFYLAAALTAYSLNLAGLCRLISGLSRGGRIDAVSPVFALITAILGGCFADTGSLVPVLSFISKLTPEGQFIAASGGSLPFCLLLVFEGILLMLLARAFSGNEKV